MLDRLIRFGGPLACALGCAWILAGCAGNGPPPADTDSSLDAIQRTIFDPNCLSSGCHDSVTQAGSLVLEAGQSYANLVNVPSSNMAAAAKGLSRVKPGDPDNSFLLIKLIGPGQGEGNMMPLIGSLSAADIERVRVWIADGALGSSLPTATASATPSSSATETDTATPSATDTATTTATPTETRTPSITPTGTLPATATPTSTLPPTATPTSTPTPSPSPTPSVTATPSVVPTPTFSMESTFAQIQATTFTTTCITVGCHNAHDAPLAGELDLETGQAYAALVGATPVNAAAQAAGFKRVDPGEPDTSFLLVKLTLPEIFDPNFGSRMPLGQPLPLDAQQIEHIRAWILRGALLDDTP